MSIDPARLELSIDQLRQFVGGQELDALIAVLESLCNAPADPLLLDRLHEEFGRLGMVQGAVLTYAPYLSVILSERLFDDQD